MKNMELLNARRDLDRILDGLPPAGREHEMVQLLVDMNRDCALAFRWTKPEGLPIRSWYPLNSALYADRIFPMESDVAANLAELFLNGQIEFLSRTAPSLTIQWYPVCGDPSRPID